MAGCATGGHFQTKHSNAMNKTLTSANSCFVSSIVDARIDLPFDRLVLGHYYCAG